MTSEHVKLAFETVIFGIKPDSPEIIKRKHPLARITLCLLHACLTCVTQQHVELTDTKKSGGFWKALDISGGNGNIHNILMSKHARGEFNWEW